MKIDKITINNYKQFINTTLDLENKLTLLAGPNNSGKTAIISLLKKIILGSSEKYTLTYLPIPIIKKIKVFISKTLKTYYDKGFEINDYENEFGNKLKMMLDENNIETYVDFTISYEEKEDIELFSDYFMDLEETKHYFYFRYKFSFSLSTFENQFSFYYSQFNDLLKDDFEKNKESVLNSIIELFISSVEENAYYCDETFSLTNKIDSLVEFRNLFYFESIQAGRPLDDDVMDNNHGLTNGLLEIAKMNNEWNDQLKSVNHILIRAINETKIKDLINESSLEFLEEILNDIEKTTGNTNTNLKLETNLSNDEINKFLKDIIMAVYDMDGVNLSEYSQGLGFSNLIYLHIKLAKYKKQIAEKKINLYVIEEPESHMHPQMQRAFIKFFFSQIEKIKFQGLITTHSNEIVRCSHVKNIRVIRKFLNEVPEYNNNYYVSKIVNMSELVNLSYSHSKDEEELSSFFDFFFEIGYSEMIFADIAILYEGDTERMLIEYAIKQEFKDLARKYIAFVQVGGAYAYNYTKLIQLLNIKTLIITDIDYGKTLVNKEEILESNSTNSTINKFYKYSVGKMENPKINSLYEWKKSNKNKLYENLIFVNFQSEEDSYGRTLEESMICKKLNIKVSNKKSLKEWRKIKTETKLFFSIPQGQEETLVSVRDILTSSTGSKIDFMYSVISNGYVKDMLPNYICEGLKWLVS